MTHVIEGIAGWLAGAAFLCALVYLAGYLLRGGNGHRGDRW